MEKKFQVTGFRLNVVDAIFIIVKAIFTE